MWPIKIMTVYGISAFTLFSDLEAVSAFKIKSTDGTSVHVLFTSHDALWVFSFGSEDVWSKHGGQILDTHLVGAGVTVDLSQKPAQTHTFPVPMTRLIKNHSFGLTIILTLLLLLLRGGLTGR